MTTMETPMMGADGTVAADAALLDFETWATMSARLLHLGPDERLEVLDQRGIDDTDWSRSDEHHTVALAAEVAAGRMGRAERYGRACAAELERRKKGAPEEPPPVAGAVAPARPALSGTMAARDLPTFVAQAAAHPLPFGAIPSPEFLASLDAPRSPPSPGATMAGGGDVRVTLPFAKPATAAGSKPARFPRLTLESYASLCAELSVYPDRAADILGKYGVTDDEARRAVDDDWGARLAENADTREEWERLRATHEGWLRQQPRR